MSLSSYDDKTKMSFTIDTNDYALIDKKNGNIVIDSPDLSAVLKQAYGQKAFWKLYMADYIQIILGVMDYKQLDVFMYISMNTRPSDNVFIGTHDKIAEATGTTRQTVSKLMKKLLEHNYIKKVQQGVYMVNPQIVMKGGIAKRNLLISYYDSEQINVPLPANSKSKKQAFEEELEVKGQQQLPLEK